MAILTLVWNASGTVPIVKVPFGFFEYKRFGNFIKILDNNLAKPLLLSL